MSQQTILYLVIKLILLQKWKPLTKLYFGWCHIVKIIIDHPNHFLGPSGATFWICYDPNVVFKNFWGIMINFDELDFKEIFTISSVTSVEMFLAGPSFNFLMSNILELKLSTSFLLSNHATTDRTVIIHSLETSACSVIFL